MNIFHLYDLLPFFFENLMCKEWTKWEEEIRQVSSNLFISLFNFKCDSDLNFEETKVVKENFKKNFMKVKILFCRTR